MRGVKKLQGIGVWTSARGIGDSNLPEAAKLVEQLGYSAFWLGGSPQLTELRPLLAATERLTLATGIVNVWQYEPATLAAEHAELAREFPGRVIAGIGVGHSEATAEYAKPLTTMRRFLDGLDAADPPLPTHERCLAALGPKMLELSAARALGALPYFTPVAHTRFARETIGEGALLATELACVIDTDSERGRASARAYAALYLGLSNYTNNLLRHGFTAEDIADGGSDQLIDAVVPHGSAGQVAEVVSAHLDAGADHVALQPVGVEGMPRREWTALAAALID
jgi:probable F420-dependent oxidoreductase